MSSQDFVKLTLQLTTMLCVAFLCGQIMRRLKQPSVVGEMAGGIILGPTIFGVLAPALHGWLFLSSRHRRAPVRRDRHHGAPDVPDVRTADVSSARGSPARTGSAGHSHARGELNVRAAGSAGSLSLISRNPVPRFSRARCLAATA